MINDDVIQIGWIIALLESVRVQYSYFLEANCLILSLTYEILQSLYKIRIKIASYFWRHYQRFLDDGIILWDKRLCNFDRVFEILNSMDPLISFT